MLDEWSDARRLDGSNPTPLADCLIVYTDISTKLWSRQDTPEYTPGLSCRLNAKKYSWTTNVNFMAFIQLYINLQYFIQVKPRSPSRKSITQLSVMSARTQLLVKTFVLFDKSTCLCLKVQRLWINSVLNFSQFSQQLCYSFWNWHIPRNSCNIL